MILAMRSLSQDVLRRLHRAGIVAGRILARCALWVRSLPPTDRGRVESTPATSRRIRSLDRGAVGGGDPPVAVGPVPPATLEKHRWGIPEVFVCWRTGPRRCRRALGDFRTQKPFSTFRRRDHGPSDLVYRRDLTCEQIGRRSPIRDASRRRRRCSLAMMVPSHKSYVRSSLEEADADS